jgi:hypothetical protein
MPIPQASSFAEKANQSRPLRNFVTAGASTVDDIETGRAMKIPTLIALLAAAMLGGLALIFLVM